MGISLPPTLSSPPPPLSYSDVFLTIHTGRFILDLSHPELFLTIHAGRFILDLSHPASWLLLRDLHIQSKEYSQASIRINIKGLKVNRNPETIEGVLSHAFAGGAGRMSVSGAGGASVGGGGGGAVDNAARGSVSFVKGTANVATVLLMLPLYC